MEVDLVLIWTFLIAFAVLAYVVLDGFDLGVGLLFPFLRGRRNRDIAISTISPVWDGNETWLVFGGAGLFAVFPLAYATILPALYAPLFAMLLGLVLRGAAFELRWSSRRGKVLWDWVFAGGSLVAAFTQGITLGALVQGIDVENRTYAGGWWDWLTPFSLLVGSALAVGYAMLGAAWLVLKTEGALRERARALAASAGIWTLVLIGVVCVATILLDHGFVERWLAWPTRIFTFFVPLLVIACAWMFTRGLVRGPEIMPFLAAIALFVLCYISLGISFYPHIIPRGVTIWEAAAPTESLAFLLAGAAALIPLLLAYSAYAYWVFRGKVRDIEEH